ncbi:DUF937 domain-containing protein [Gelidibacter salicanalis]|uniref:DUF937 domain-containing protein n=1 Tax=Gelidibacter salicanalis TaxID=291193 RepID=A0A934NK52_9FLAO|nr:DUF937 domain-containing protein [Gelidibacter salicanalis]MBJ7882674.1 DUF937 domain-containing protein [Gelidibacter salicanalis]
MSGILDLLNSEMGKSIVSGVAGQTNQPKNKTQDVLMMAMPVLMAAMKRNAASPEGAQGLLNAINSQHDGSILNDLGSLFSGGVDDKVINDGSKILGHVLGNKQNTVEHAISAKSGIDTGSVAQILKVAAPILMGMLSNQAKQQNVDSPSGLEGMLSGLLKGNSPQNEQSFLESILDADGDGSVIDDVTGMVLGNTKKRGLGGLLGGLFGDKKQ